MSFKEQQLITEYRLQDIASLRQSIFSLKSLIVNFDYTETDKFSIWDGINILSDQLDFISGNEPTEEQKMFQENVILFIDNNLLFTLHEKLKGLSDESQINRQSLNELNISNPQLSLQLEYVCIILNLIKKSGEVYSSVELFKILDNTTINEVEKFRILNTLVFLLNDDENREVGRIELPKILASGVAVHKKLYNWEEAIRLFLILTLVIKEFSSLPESVQYFIINNYFYCAQVFGIPINKMMERALYETRNIQSYIEKNLIFLDAVKRNEEIVLIGKDLQVEISIGELLGKYIDKKLPDLNSEKNISVYLEDLYVDVKEKSLYIKWLKSFFSLYFYLEQANLISNNVGGELNEKEIADNELIKLCTFFALGPIGFDEIIKYYQNQEKINVPLNRFINQLKKLVSLKDEGVIEDLIKLTNILRDNNIIFDSDELIEYHESDNQFHWNEDYLK